MGSLVRRSHMSKAGGYDPFSIPQRRSALCHPSRQVTSDGFWNGGDPLTTTLPLFMIQIGVMMATTRLLYFLLRPLKQPRVVAEILAGIILGPSVLGRSKRWAEHVFPPEGENLIRTAADLGMVFFLFLIGVKMEPVVVLKSGKKPLAIGLISMLVPLLLVSAVSLALMDEIPANIARGPFLMFVPASISVTAFPNLAQMLAELDLLNSDLGQLALSSALVNDCFGWFFMALFTAIDQAQGNALAALWSLLSLAGMIVFLVFVFRPWAKSVNRSVPSGALVGEGYVLAILLGVTLMAFLSDIIGATMADGPLIMGLAMPDGPPLAAALMEKTELIVTEVLLPLLFVVSGMTTDLSVVMEWKKWVPMVIIIFVGYFGKLAGASMTSFYWDMYVGSAFVLGLIMSFRGVVEVMVFLNWWTGALLDDKAYTVLLLSTTLFTAIATPLVVIMYKPFNTGAAAAALGGRTVQQTRPNMELRVLACVHSEEPVPPIINFLEAIHATDATPLCVYVLHLVELVGRAAPLLISHRSSIPDKDDPILNAFSNYEQRMGAGPVAVQPFTTVSPHKTMHIDICKLAQDKAVALVVVPFSRRDTLGAMISKADQAMRAMTPVVQANAPCSVGVLVHSGRTGAAEVPIFGRVAQHVGVIFWGGPDDREALAVGSRMAGSERVCLTVARFLPTANRGDERERRLDDDAVREFRAVHGQRGNVAVREVAVKDPAQTIAAIRAMGDEYELLVVGRQQQTLCEGLTEWSERPELGALGDMFASADRRVTSSVLVVQQHL